MLCQNGWEIDSRVVVFPEDFTTEAEALRSGLAKTSGGIQSPSELRRLPALDEQPPVRQVLEQIESAMGERRERKEKSVVLRANAPYSVLATLVDPPLFYRWLVKSPEDVHTGLEKISAGLCGYIGKAFEKGVCILSLADPYANVEILGEKHYRAFAGLWLVKLLKTLMSAERDACIHLCPYSSLMLECCGFLVSKTVSLGGEQRMYLDVLSELGKTPGIPLLGHRCIYTEGANDFIILTLL